jgi:hypothetical protein
MDRCMVVRIRKAYTNCLGPGNEFEGALPYVFFFFSSAQRITVEGFLIGVRF